MDTRIVGLLGGGQLGRMLIESANRLNIQVVVLDGPATPAKQIANIDHIDGSFRDPASIWRLARLCDVLTVEIEHVDVEVLQALEDEKITQVNPSAATLRIIQDKFAQKEHLISHALPIVQSILFENFAQAERILGLPYMLKAKKQAYDGRGNYVVRKKSDFDLIRDNLPSSDQLYAERWASFECELAVMVIKTRYERIAPEDPSRLNDCIPFPTVRTVHENSVCKLVFAPAWDVSLDVATRAQELAVSAAATFTGKGVFGVEMFLMKDGELLINEIAPRPHNSGHYTIEACIISQYDAQLRAILNLPMPKAPDMMKTPQTHAIMLNLLGSSQGDFKEVAKAALGVQDAHIHLYGKGESRTGRKMGHITILGSSALEVWRRMEPLIRMDERLHKLDSMKYTMPVPWSNSNPCRALVGVTMGSDSDLDKMKPGLIALESMDIQFEVRITSAHRQPQLMLDYAKTAAERGLKVLITAAGGAAALPGMIASATLLPVIGVPIKCSTLDGMDSLLSIVQMPRGVPVATVAIDNSVNAALLAARILAISDDLIRSRVEAYISTMQYEVTEKGRKLMSNGWRQYER